MDSKDALTWYVQRYPEVQRALRDGGASRTEEDATVVGFGPHAQMTYKALYGSPEMKRLVITVCEEMYCFSLSLSLSLSLSHFLNCVTVNP